MRDGPYDSAVLAGYAPQTLNSLAKNVWETPKTWTLGIPERSILVIMLHASAHVSPLKGCTGGAGEGKTNENGEMMLDWLQSTGLHATNTFDELGPTYYGPRGCTRIDYIVTSGSVWEEVTTEHDLDTPQLEDCTWNGST